MQEPESSLTHGLLLTVLSINTLNAYAKFGRIIRISLSSPRMSFTIIVNLKKTRENIFQLWNFLAFCSIDPPGSKDVDDTLSIRQLPNNLLEVCFFPSLILIAVPGIVWIHCELRTAGLCSPIIQ